MPRIFFVFLFALMAAQVLLAPQASAQRLGQDACARDVSRLCRAQMNDGDQVVLACLKQHRGRLSKACAKVLTDNGE
jgi:Cysteine rich repeat